MINTSCDWQLAIYCTNGQAESVSETCTIACRARRDSEVTDRPAHNHLGRNLDYSAKAALVQSTFPTVAASEAVLKSVDVYGAWISV